MLSPASPGRAGGKGSPAGRRDAAWLQGRSLAERQNKHCIILTTAPGCEDGDGYEVPSPLLGTNVLKPPGRAVTMHELQYRLGGGAQSLWCRRDDVH